MLPTWPAAASGRRRLLLHAGLHKTGTTALQLFLSQNTAALRAAGVLYPHAGRPDGSIDHHTVAWQMTGDRRYRAADGTVDAMVAEIVAFEGDAIISSEAFSTLFRTPGGLGPLLRHPDLRGHDVTVLFYVRDQASFAESLYFEMLGNGMADEAARTAATILAHGDLRFREWIFPFAYHADLRRLLARPRLNVSVRAYACLTGGSIVSDFLAFAGLAALAPASAERINPRIGLGEAVVLFCWHRFGWQPPTPAVRQTVLRMADGRSMPLTINGGPPATGKPAGVTWLHEAVTNLAGRRLAGLSPAVRAAMIKRFEAGNRELCAACSLPEQALAIAPAPPPGALLLERLFSRDLQAAVIASSPQSQDALAAVFGAAILPG